MTYKDRARMASLFLEAGRLARQSALAGVDCLACADTARSADEALRRLGYEPTYSITGGRVSSHKTRVPLEATS